MEGSSTDQFQQPKQRWRPYVILNAAMTLDGKIATRTGDSRISSTADLKRLHRMRSQVDAVMIGVGTQLRDNPRLTVRHTSGKNPIRIVVDSRARTPMKSRVFSGGDPIVAVSKSAPAFRIRRLEQEGANVIQCGKTRVDLRILLRRLWAMGIKRLLLEGGGKLNWSMLNARLVDEIRVTLAPLVVGGKRATTLADGVGVARMSRAIKLRLQGVTRHDGELLLNYEVQKQ